MNHDYLRGARVGSTAMPALDALIAGAPLLPPGGFGSAVAPAHAFYGDGVARSREARRHTADREEVEKGRLRARRFGFGAYAEPGGLTAPDSGPDAGAAYAADVDRFYTDVAAEERHRREEAGARRAAEHARKRDAALARDEERWARMEAEAREFDEKTRRLQAAGTAAMKNLTGRAADPVAGTYEASARGAALRAAEEAARAAAAGRAAALAAHGRSAPYDPIAARELGPGAPFHAQAYAGGYRALLGVGEMRRAAHEAAERAAAQHPLAPRRR